MMKIKKRASCSAALLAVMIGVFGASSNIAYAQTPSATPVTVVCRANFYYGGNWCGPCNTVKTAMSFYDASKKNIDTRAIATRFKGYLAVKDVDRLDPEIVEKIGTVPTLDMFDKKGNSIGSVKAPNQVITKLTELEANINDPAKCGIVSSTPSPTPPQPTPSVNPRPTTTLRPRGTPRPRPTLRPTPSPTSTSTPSFFSQLSTRGIASPLIDGISNAFSWVFSRIGEGFMAIIDLFTK